MAAAQGRTTAASHLLDRPSRPHHRPGEPSCPSRRRRWSIQTVLIPDGAIWLDTTRIYREAYERAGRADGLLTGVEADHEAAAEFIDDAGEI